MIFTTNTEPFQNHVTTRTGQFFLLIVLNNVDTETNESCEITPVEAITQQTLSFQITYS